MKHDSRRKFWREQIENLEKQALEIRVNLTRNYTYPEPLRQWAINTLGAHQRQQLISVLKQLTLAQSEYNTAPKHELEPPS